MAEALIGLGSNLGDRAATLTEAVDQLGRVPRTRVLRVSPWIETRAAGGPPGQPNYLNGAVVVETALGPRALLSHLQSLEKRLGRTDGARWAPRPIDLDLLLFGSRRQSEAGLVVPHPRMAWRRFVLQPAAAVAPQWVHPEIGWSLARLLAHLEQSPALIVFTGPNQYDAEALTEGVHSARPQDTRALPLPEGLPRCEFGEHTVPEALELDVALAILAQWRIPIRKHPLQQTDEERADAPRNEVFDLWPFWPGRLKACARTALGEQQYAEFTDRLQTVWRALPRPRLVVAVDAMADGMPAKPSVPRVYDVRRLAPSKGVASADATRWPEAFWDELDRGDHGPVMRLIGISWEEAIVEVAAAIEAMQQ